jgi:hypothetical protein
MTTSGAASVDVTRAAGVRGGASEVARKTEDVTGTAIATGTAAATVVGGVRASGRKNARTATTGRSTKIDELCDCCGTQPLRPSQCAHINNPVFAVERLI